MSKEENLPASGLGLPDVASDPLDELLLEMFLRKDMALLAASGDIDPEQLSDAGEIPFAAATTHPAEQQKELATGRDSAQTIDDSAETIVDPGSEFHEDGGKEGFHKMIRNVADFEKQGRVTFHGEYRKATRLGRGGQGIVYLIQGEDDFSAAYALKAFLPQAYENLDDFAADMTRMQRIASLIHHQPHDDLVDVAWFGQRDGVYTMLMQYIDGFDLRRLLQPQLLPLLQQCVEAKRWEDINNVVYSVNGSQQLALQPAIAVYIIERVLRGVGAMHNRDMVHGDIKPSNIMLTASGSVKIIDVGSAFEGDAPPTRHHFTPAYAAPEFLETEVMSKQSDLASIGYMLIELLSGRPITDAVSAPDRSTRNMGTVRTPELLEAKRTLPDRLPEILPPNILASNHLVQLCRCLIDPDLNQRFPTAAVSIVDRKGTYEFNKDLILSNLGVCNFHEVSQWLADVKQAMRLVREDPSLPQ